MPRPYSGDLRARVIEDISTGASRREAAERYGVSPSAVVLARLKKLQAMLPKYTASLK